MIDRLRQMAIFAKTIDHGSFRGAAKELRLSPSVISHHISQLEENLGLALIYRSTRKLTLTRDGERLLIAARKMLEAVESELQDLSATADVPSGELRLTVPSVLSHSGITERIAAFSIAYPRIQLSVDYSDIRRNLIDDGYDFAIRMGPKSRNSPTSRSLFSVRRKLIASTSYLRSRPEAKEPNDLLGWDWISLAPVQNVPMKFSKKGGRTISIKPETHLFTNDATALYRLARAGAGLAIVPEFLMEQDAIEGSVQHLLPEWELQTIDVFAVWPANAPKHGLIHLALNALSESYRDAKQPTR